MEKRLARSIYSVKEPRCARPRRSSSRPLGPPWRSRGGSPLLRRRRRGDGAWSTRTRPVRPRGSRSVPPPASGAVEYRANRRLDPPARLNHTVDRNFSEHRATAPSRRRHRLRGQDPRTPPPSISSTACCGRQRHASARRPSPTTARRIATNNPNVATRASRCAPPADDRSGSSTTVSARGDPSSCAASTATSSRRSAVVAHRPPSVTLAPMRQRGDRRDEVAVEAAHERRDRPGRDRSGSCRDRGRRLARGAA